MSNYDTHFEKYTMFNNDAENEDISTPLRIEAYFYSAFHLIEAVTALNAVHIEKHQKVRKQLEENPDIFNQDTETIWRSFQEIESQIRPGQIYGGSINGEKLQRTQNLYKKIENVCEGLVKKDDTE